MILFSSSPSNPSSPACGLRPKTAILGLLILKSFFSDNSSSRIFNSTRSLVMRLFTSLRGTCSVTNPTRKSCPVMSIKVSVAWNSWVRYSVWPLNGKSSPWMVLLSIGPVTNPSMTPSFTSSTAFFRESKAPLADSTAGLPGFISITSSQQETTLIDLGKNWPLFFTWL